MLYPGQLTTRCGARPIDYNAHGVLLPKTKQKEFLRNFFSAVMYQDTTNANTVLAYAHDDKKTNCIQRSELLSSICQVPSQAPCRSRCTHLVRGGFAVRPRKLRQESRLSHRRKSHKPHSCIACFAHVETPASTSTASPAPGISLEEFPINKEQLEGMSLLARPPKLI